MPELAYVNGEIMPIGKAFVPIEDRGYQFGDAVYEGIASHSGKLFFVKEHLERLKRSLNELSFPEVSIDQIEKGMNEMYEKSGFKRAFVYLQISRGVSPRFHGYSNSEPLQIIMTVKEMPGKHPLVKEGAGVITIEDYRWGRCDIKTVQLLPNCLSKQQAVDSGAYDAVFVTKENIVREATSSNVFIVKDGRLLTHPLTNNILPGVTRRKLLEICSEENIPCQESFYTLDDLYQADEVFLSGTGTEVLPIVSVDKRDIADRKPGKMSLTLLEALRTKSGARN